MKKFVQKIVLFTITLLSIIFILEYRLFTMSSAFGKKSEFIEKNKENIEVLVLGTSHNQNGINPQYFDSMGANIAFGGQDLKLDSLLLEKYIQDLSSLKYVIFEMSYHSLEHRNNRKYHRNVLYLRYHGIDNFGDYLNLDIRKYSIFFSAPHTYLKFVFDFNSVEVNEYGFQTELIKQERFYQMDYDILKIHAAKNDKFVTRHKHINLPKYQKNTITFQGMIDLCSKNNVTPIILIPPVYKTYYDNMIPEKKDRRDTFLNHLMEKYHNIILMDYENNPLFTVEDFMNEDHLNVFGARKLTEEINENILTN